MRISINKKVNSLSTRGGLNHFLFAYSVEKVKIIHVKNSKMFTSFLCVLLM